MTTQTADTRDGNVVIGSRESDICPTVNMLTRCMKKNVWCIPEDLVRLLAEFEVEPAKFSIITPHNEMVTGWVNVHRRYPPNARVEQVQELLLGQII